ncbi:MAG: glycosyltransferase [Gemmatimonadales bacterium]|nr:glycosyltransferase [Gemmatimonadales bacterium]
MTDAAPALSVILPCYASAELAAKSVEVLAAYLPSVAKGWEIVVVDDGGNDFSATPLPAAPNIRLLRHDRNRGKGAAVRTGMLAARGRVRVFTDADVPYDRELIPVMAEYITARGFHVAIGDRTLPESLYSQAMPITRRALSSVASRAIGSLVTGGFFDTQCGIKAMRGDVADELFRMVRIDRFAFEVEVVYLALKHGLDIKRVPVRLRRNLVSSVRPVSDAARGAWDLLAMKLRQMRGAYRSEALERIVTADYAAMRAPFGPAA